MRPLLWKEMRHVRLWVLSGAALVAALEWMYQSENFRRSFEGAYLPIFMPFLLAVAAIGLGAAQIAGERHARTLDYLRVRPVAPATVVWAKFLAGTIALALLVAALVGLGFVNPIETGDTGIRAIRDQVGFRSVVLTLFPRYWLVYSLTLFFSVLLDRSAKVAAALAALAVAVIGLASYFAEFAPFSGFVYWLPFFDSTGGLVQAAKSGAMIGLTGLGCSGAAVLVTAASAALLNRSPERYLGNRGLVLVAAGLAGAAVISAQLAARWVPVVAPAGSFELSREVDWAGIVARGNTVAVTLDGRVEFLDFSTPSAPKLLRDVTIPLWTTQSDFDIEKSVMAGDTVYLVGHKKAVPVDEAAILMVKTDGSSSAISLGPVRPEEYTSAPVIAGVFLYVGRTQERVCSIHVYELASRQEAAVLVIDRLRPPVPAAAGAALPARALPLRDVAIRLDHHRHRSSFAARGDGQPGVPPQALLPLWLPESADLAGQPSVRNGFLASKPGLLRSQRSGAPGEAKPAYLSHRSLRCTNRVRP